jgi:hypothetical protein
MNMNHNLLLERLRLQSIIQRLIRQYGREGCLDLMHQAIELELPLLKSQTNIRKKSAAYK